MEIYQRTNFYGLSAKTAYDAADLTTGFMNGHLYGSVEKEPANEAAQLMLVQSFVATPDDPVECMFSNDTDVSTAEERFYGCIYNEVPLFS